MEIIDENGNPIHQNNSPQESKRIISGILGILLGVFGIHKFILGYTKEGIIMLVLSLISCGSIPSLIGFIEGIIYLTKSDDEFIKMYQTNYKGWF